MVGIYFRFLLRIISATFQGAKSLAVLKGYVYVTANHPGKHEKWITHGRVGYIISLKDP